MIKRSLLPFALFLLPLVINAQTLEDDISYIQNIYGMEKRKLVTEYMKIPESMATAFWTTYDNYEAARRDLGRKRLKILNEYSEQYASLTEEKADQLAKDMLANNVQFQKLYQTYYTTFKKATSALMAAQFIQLETYLQNSIWTEVQAEIPFLGELDKLRSDK